MILIGKINRKTLTVHSTLRLLLILHMAILGMIALGGVAFSAEKNTGQRQGTSNKEKIRIQQIAADPRGGRAYKLVYEVAVPIEIHWAFKTDFDNDFLVENKFILEHQFSSQTGNIVITRDRYSNGPDVFFRWKTKVIPQTYRLEFTLTNPEACGQRFHYGYIQLQSVAEGTRVTQVAYFDFLGVSFWAAYPWAGGMTEFLSYTARWEKDTSVRLKHRYAVDKK